MNRRLFWKLCLIIVTAVVALLYVIDQVTTRTEEDMSFLDLADQRQIVAWGREAERLFHRGDKRTLDTWLAELQREEQTWVAVARADIQHLAGETLGERFSQGYNMGRNVEWKIHLYFEDNPVMEVPFADSQASFLVLLPERMRPGSYWEYVRVSLQVILPAILLAVLTLVLYRHIMAPLRELQRATRDFSHGNFDVRVRQTLGNRSDELSELAATFDQMAVRIGELIVSQRQLIADLSHELRTPLTRLDIAVESLSENDNTAVNAERIQRESRHIRKLVENTLSLAWLDNERPDLKQETLDLVDLLDVLMEDARFEFPDRKLNVDLPAEAGIDNSNHRALGQALENILRNALRFTPVGKSVAVSLVSQGNHYVISIDDQGPGVPEQYLEMIFQPFFRLDVSRPATGESFGLGLALAQRQIAAVGGRIEARNLPPGGLSVTVTLPKS